MFLMVIFVISSVLFTLLGIGVTHGETMQPHPAAVNWLCDGGACYIYYRMALNLGAAQNAHNKI